MHFRLGFFESGTSLLGVTRADSGFDFFDKSPDAATPVAVDKAERFVAADALFLQTYDLPSGGLIFCL